MMGESQGKVSLFLSVITIVICSGIIVTLFYLDHLMMNEARQIRTDISTIDNSTSELSDVMLSRDRKGKSENAGDPVTGTSYIRWGRDTCPPSSELVYSGFIWSKHKTSNISWEYDHFSTMDGVNSGKIGCLPNYPEWNPVPENFTSDDSKIISVSVLLGQMGHIESKHLGISDQVNNQYSNGWRRRSVKIFRIVCSVCRAAHPAQVTLPDKNTCPVGWKMEYSGLLAKTKDSQHVCLDSQPTPSPITVTDRNSRYYAPSYPWLEYSRLPFHFGYDFGPGIWRHRRKRRSMLYDYFPYWWLGYRRRLPGSQQSSEPPLVSFLHLVLVRCFRGISCPTDVRNIRTVTCVVCTK